MRSLARIAAATTLLSIALIAACAMPSASESQGSSEDALTVTAGRDPNGLGRRPPVVGGDLLYDREWYIDSLGSRCWDFGGAAFWYVGAPVFLYTCNGTIAQRVRVTEIDAHHDVQLRISNTGY